MKCHDTCKLSSEMEPRSEASDSDLGQVPHRAEENADELFRQLKEALFRSDSADEDGPRDVRPKETPHSRPGLSSQNDVNWETLYDDFAKFLSNPLYHGKKEATALQMVSQVRKVVKTLPGTTPKEKFEKKNFKRLETQGKLSEMIAEGKSPGTVKSYLCSIRLYVRYLKGLEMVEHGNADNCVFLVEGWYAALRDATTSREHERWKEMSEKLEDMPNSIELLEQYNESENARKAMKLLAVANRGSAISDQDFETMRDHLMVIVGFRNAQRAGAVIHMTIREFLNRRRAEDSDVVLVRCHKTFPTYGHAAMVVKKPVAYLMEKYLDHVRHE